MKDEQFNASIDYTLTAANNMLTRKSSGYSKQDDRLHNFRVAAALNGCTMEQALWGMLTKHIISIRDMVLSGESYSDDVWDEKVGDAINYLAILKAITVESPSPSDKVLMDLRENLVGSRLPSDARSGITIKNDGDILTRNPNLYSVGVESTMTPQQRDLESIKRVADNQN